MLLVVSTTGLMLQRNFLRIAETVSVAITNRRVARLCVTHMKGCGAMLCMPSKLKENKTK